MFALCRIMQVGTRIQPFLTNYYPSAIFLMTNYFKSRDLNPPKVTSIITSSETLLPEHRTEIENFWGCKVYDWYGLGERVAAIGECEDGGFHINLEYGIVEFKDVSGSNQKEIIATSFWNFAMPLIRYSTRDLITPSTNSKCSCGRSLLTDRLTHTQHPKSLSSFSSAVLSSIF